MDISILSDLVITEVSSVSTLYSHAGAGAKRCDRQCWAIAIKFEGETYYSSGGKRFLSDINHVIILPKGCSYEWECTKSGHFCILEFKSDLTYHEPLSFSVNNGEKLLQSIRELEYKRNRRDILYKAESIRDTYSILLSIAESNTEKYVPKHKRTKLQPVIDYISLHYSENIKNDTLASIAGMSTVYFRKQFTNIFGISPISYIKNLRIEKAKEMLKSDYGTLTDIARMLGYSSLYDFSRDFKKHTGIPPSKY